MLISPTDITGIFSNFLQDSKIGQLFIILRSSHRSCYNIHKPDLQDICEDLTKAAAVHPMLFMYCKILFFSRTLILSLQTNYLSSEGDFPPGKAQQCKLKKTFDITPSISKPKLIINEYLPCIEKICKGYRSAT